jgi:hypothetical protein
VLTLSGARISRASAFTHDKRLIETFGLPLTATAEALAQL